jgi:hypothetical protein
MKMLLYYYLWISIIPRLMNSNQITKILNFFINSIALPFITSTSNFNCFLGNIFKDIDVQFYIVECVWLIIFSIIVILIFLLLIYIKRIGKKYDREGAVTGSIYIYFSIQPQILLLFLSSMYCI